MKPRFLTAREAAALIPSNCTLLTEGFVGAGFPEELAIALERRFLETREPRNLTLFHVAGQGDGGEQGLNRLGYRGMVSRLICGHLNLAPRLQKLAADNSIAAYNLPMGVMAHLVRDAAAGKPGVLTQVGLGTFVDPRLEGGRLNARTQEDILRRLEIDGQEYLFYKTIPIDVALLRGTYADEKGNISMEKEGLITGALAAAQACRNHGGLVLVQVEKIVAAGSLDPRLVKIPGHCVDIVVEAENTLNHKQTYASQYNPAFCGALRYPNRKDQTRSSGIRYTIACRAAKELPPEAVVNLGIGMPEGVALAAGNLGREDFVLTIEAGLGGGVPQGGLDFGCALNPESIIDMPSQFDFYQGGGLDIAFLGMAQVDREGNVNVSKFGHRIPGCGGFIDISQNARKVVFCGTFTAGGFQGAIAEGKLKILREGRQKKFLRQVEQVTFSGSRALARGQEVMYITERAVFQLKPAGLELIELTGGTDLERDVLAQMEFAPGRP